MSGAREDIYARLAEEIARRRTPDRPFLAGVTGTDCSGKTVFSEGLGDYLRERGIATQLVALDDFHQPAAVRHAGEDRDEDHYRRIKEGREFDFTRLIDEVLKPARNRRDFTVTLTSIDWRSDARDRRELSVTPETVLIMEGVFLMLDSVRPWLDYLIYLDVNEEECFRRAKRRDPEATWRRYETRYLPAARAHREEYPPEQCADLVIDNTGWERPRWKRGNSGSRTT